MSEIKPVYQTTIKNDGYFSVINLTSTDENERDKWKAAGYDVKTLYPAAAYEYMKNCADELLAENEAQAKRIAELEAVLRIAKSEIDEASKSEGVLFGNDPLVCKKIEAVLEVLEESKLRQKFADKSAWTKLLKSKQDTKKDE